MSMEAINQTKNIPAEKENKESLITKFLTTIAELRKNELSIAEQIKKTGDNARKQILEADLNDVQKRINEYEISIKKYRNTVKTNQLKDIAGEERVAEVIDFKKKQKTKNENIAEEDFSSEIGEKFLSDFENFKKEKQG